MALIIPTTSSTTSQLIIGKWELLAFRSFASGLCWSEYLWYLGDSIFLRRAGPGRGAFSVAPLISMLPVDGRAESGDARDLGIRSRMGSCQLAAMLELGRLWFHADLNYLTLQAWVFRVSLSLSLSLRGTMC